MGLYCTSTSIQILMIGTEFDSATTSLCNKMITHAEGEIEKKLSKRYDVDTFNNTSTSVPPILTSICETLVTGYMYKFMNRSPSKDQVAFYESFISQAMDNLTLYADYKADLVDSSGAVIADMSNTSYRVKSTTSDYTPTFAEDNELNWAVDQDKLDDIDSERD